MDRWINGDGERHPLENTLALLVLGLAAAAVTALLVEAWATAAWLAIAGGLVAAYDEFIAETTGQRRLLLGGFAVCVVSLAVAMANGGML